MAFYPENALAGPLPNRLVAASVRGTTEIPQVYGASVLRVGVIATGMLARHELNIDGIMEGSISDAQVDMMGRAVNAAHLKHGIAPIFDPKRREGTTREMREQGEPALISARGLASTAYPTVRIAGKSIIFYAAAVLPRKFLAAVTEAGEDSLLQVGRPLVQELFENPGHASKVAALTMLWELGEDMLKSKDVLAEAKAYRAEVEKAYGNRPRTNELRVEEEQRMYNRLISHLGSATVQDEIYRQTGFLVPPGAIGGLADNISFYFSHQT